MVCVLCVSWLCVWVCDVLYVSVRSCYVCHSCVSGWCMCGVCECKFMIWVMCVTVVVCVVCVS